MHNYSYRGDSSPVNKANRKMNVDDFGCSLNVRVTAVCEKPLVTVYCPAYNHERYIRSALEGFISQKTTFPFEVIVHDDASTDGTVSIIKEYAAKHPSLIKPIIQNENQYSKGVSILQSVVLPMARGKYIAYCEGDDYWCDENKLQLQVDYLESHPDCMACVHDTRIFDCRNNSEQKLSKMRGDGVIPKALLFTSGSSYHTSSLMSRTELYNSLPAFVRGVKGVGDYPLRVYLALTSDVYYFDRVMSVYRYRTEGSWSSRIHADKASAIETHGALIEMLREANEWSNHSHESLFESAMREQEFMRFDVAGEWRRMLSLRYREVFKTCSLKRRVRIVLSAVFPRLGRWLSG